MKIALFGCGRIGQIYLKNILLNQKAQLAGIVDPLNPKLPALSKRWKVPILTSEQVFRDKSIQGILIASSSDTHIELIERALKSGKAILCEKPLDSDINKVRKIVKKIDQAKCLFSLGFNRRFDDSIFQLKARLTRGEIGKLENLTVISRDPAPPPISYIKVSGGMYMDMTIHDFDIVRWLIGSGGKPNSGSDQIVQVYARGGCHVNSAIARAGDIDTSIITMETGKGVFIQIINSRRAKYGYDQRIEAFGSKGLIRVENHLENSTEKYGESLSKSKPLNFFLERYEKAYQNELDEFINCYRNKKPVLVNHHDGFEAMKLARACQKSLLEKKPIRL